MPLILVRYLVAVGVVLLALGLKLLVTSPTDEFVGPVLFFSAAVMVSAWYGGLASGLASVALSALLVNFFFLPPWRSATTGSTAAGLQLGVFLFEGVLISLLSQALHTARRRAEKGTRAAQDANRNLQKAKEAADAANRAKGEFLANTSHELRTPMNAIIGMTDLALEEEVSETVRDYLQTARDSADLLLGLINDILDFSKIESGKFTLDVVEFDLRDLIDETLKVFAPRAAEKRLELVGQIDPGVPERVVGDPRRLQQILTNLVSNAVKFTESGDVRVRVVAESSPHGRARLNFEVRDTGAGISQENQQRIFAPFTQADPSLTRRHGGTGLGLAITSELIRLMEGRLRLESELGRGSVFAFSIERQ